MKIQILEIESEEWIDSEILKAIRKDMPFKRNGWQFTWRTLFKVEGADFYKLFVSSNREIQGMLMLSLMNDEMLYMNNIEVAPSNYGSNGKHEHVAGALIAYACLKSFELANDNYRGFLTFESKTKLIPFYQKKYGAVLAMGHRMFIEPETGRRLIKQYLNLEI